MKNISLSLKGISTWNPDTLTCRQKFMNRLQLQRIHCSLQSNFRDEGWSNSNGMGIIPFLLLLTFILFMPRAQGAG